MSGAMPQYYKVVPGFRGETSSMYLAQGSTFLKPFADSFGIELDQINFLFCEIIGIIGGCCIRKVIPPHLPGNRDIRLLVCGLLGVLMGLFSFGLRSLYLWAVTSLCYMISLRGDPRYSHLIVFCVSVGYLSYLHIYRMLRDYGGYSLDITMPMMVIVQKITAFAFGIHDGKKDFAGRTKKLSEDRVKHAIGSIPGYWEFCSYIFCFQSILCGPFCFFDEYMAFIEGRCLEPKKKESDEKTKTGSVDSSSTSLLPPPHEYPSPLWPVMKKVFVAVVFCIIHVTLVPSVPLDLLTEEKNVGKLTIIQLMFYLLIGTTFIRLKYYVAWLLTDAVANASGLGFNGYDELGKPKWDLVSNVDIIEFEFSTNFRAALTAWNSCTARWLRYVAYDRALYAPMLATYTLSAFWHGFYPGYYVTFVGGALFTEAARWVRRVIRPYFQKWPVSRLVYDFGTFLTTRLYMAYATFPFVLLELRHAWNIYKAMYFWCHILAFLAMLVLPFLNRKEQRPKAAGSNEVKVDGATNNLEKSETLLQSNKGTESGARLRKVAGYGDKPET